MRLQALQTNALRVIALMAGLCLAISAKATVPVSDLPDFDNLDNFAQLGNQLNNSDVTINGNVGVSENGLLSLGPSSTINGDAYIGNGATLTPGVITGSTFTGQDLTTEQNTVFTASEGLNALMPDVVISSLQTSSLSFDVPAGQVYVVNLNGGLDLDNENISQNGDGVLVLNILGSFNLAGTASILGDASNTFINYLGTGTMTTSPDNVINGQVFIPNATADLEGTWFGSIFSGDQTVSMLSRSTLNGIPVPEPGTLVLAGLGGIFMILLRRRHFIMKRPV